MWLLLLGGCIYTTPLTVFFICAIYRRAIAAQCATRAPGPSQRSAGPAATPPPNGVGRGTYPAPMRTPKGRVSTYSAVYYVTARRVKDYSIVRLSCHLLTDYLCTCNSALMYLRCGPALYGRPGVGSGLCNTVGGTCCTLSGPHVLVEGLVGPVGLVSPSQDEQR